MKSRSRNEVSSPALCAHGAAAQLEQLINYRPTGAVLSAFTYTRTPEGYPTKITYEDGRYREYGYDDAHQLTSETHKTAQGTAILTHEYTYDMAGNRHTKVYDGTDTVTYTTDETNELDSTTGTRGAKIDVTGTAADANLDHVAVTPSHDSGTEGTPVTASLRPPFYIARGVDLWDDTDIAIDATAYDKAGNTAEATQKTSIKLETSATETFTHDDAGCLAQDALHKYYYDDEHRLGIGGHHTYFTGCNVRSGARRMRRNSLLAELGDPG